MPWYKYLPQKFAKLMVEEGIIKVGTLFEYKNEEELGSDIGDTNEGVITEWSNDKEIKRTQEDLNRIERLAIRIGEGLEGVQVNNVVVQATQQSPNLYIYSVSDVFNVHIMRKLCQDYDTKYDACVRINDPKSFIMAVSKLFNDKGRYEVSAYCQYMSRTRHYKDQSSHPALIKEPKYKYQKEIRCVWSPTTSEQISSEMIQVNEIKLLCEIIYTDAFSKNGNGTTMVKFKDNVFKNDRILLDSSEFVNCEFNNCTIVYGGSGPVMLNSCIFNSCRWEFTGAAQNTINFMSSFLQISSRILI